MESDSNDFLDRKNLLETLLTLSLENRTGILSLHTDDTVSSQFQLQNGTISAGVWGNQQGAGFLKRLIEQSGMVPEKVIKKSLKRAHSRSLDLPAALSQEGGPLPARIREMTGAAIQEELWRLAGLESTWWKFTEEPPEESPFDPDMLALKMKLNIDFLVVDIAGRESNWNILDQIFPARLEVLVTRAASRRYFDAGPGKFEEQQSILVLIDGERDVDDILRDSPLDPFKTLKLLHRFKVLGEIRELNPAELIQVAMTFKSKGRFDKCLRLYLRAEIQGKNTYDLDLTIGNIYETIGQEQEAFDRYISYAEKCLNAGERGSGTEAFRRAVAIRPSNIDIREKFLRMLDSVEDRKEYLKELRTFLGLARSSQDHERTRNALCALITAGAATEEDFREYVTSLTRERGPLDAYQDLYRIAQDLLKEDRFEEALPVLESAAHLRSDSLDVQEALTRVYLSTGQNERAATTLETISHLIRAKDLHEEERRKRLEETHRELLKLNPDHVDALRYLARRAEKNGDLDQAATHLGRLRVLFKKSGNRTRLAYILNRLLKITTDDPDLKIEYAECQIECGRLIKGTRCLREAASLLAAEEETRERAEGIFTRVLEHTPFDREARSEIARLYESLGNHRAARLQWEQLAKICLADGCPSEAADIYEELIKKNPDESDYIRCVARAYLDLLPEQSVVDRLFDILKKVVALEDYGFARWIVSTGGNLPRLRKVLDSIPDRKTQEAEIAKGTSLLKKYRLRVRKVISASRDRLKKARVEWDAERQSLLQKLEHAIEEKQHVLVSPSDTGEGEDGLAGLGGGIQKIETTFNLPSSILEITKKLKGLT